MPDRRCTFRSVLRVLSAIAFAISALVGTVHAESGAIRSGLIKVGPVYSLPSGDFFYKTEGGPGIGCDVFVKVGQHSFVGARVVRTGISWDRENLKRGAYWPSEVEEVEAWSFVAAYRYEKPLSSRDDGRFRGAVDFGLGTLVRTRGSLAYPLGGPNSPDGLPLEKGTHKAMLVVHMGGELIRMLTPRFGLSLELAADNGLLTRILAPVVHIQDNQSETRPIETGSVVNPGLRLVAYLH